MEDQTASRLVDLSHVITEGMVTYKRCPEIDGTEVGGAARGYRGRWVQLRRRRRHPEADVESPQSAEPAVPQPG